jgi:hypothetical protein
MDSKVVIMLSKHFDDEQWKLLQGVRPTRNQKEVMRARILESIQTPPPRGTQFQWRSMVAACLLFLICGSFLYYIFHENTSPATTGKMVLDENLVSWNLKDVYGKKSAGGLDFYKGDQTVTIGVAEQVAAEEMKEIIQSAPMHENQKLENFPYPTHMYIEHVKMMDVALRYHFFIEVAGQPSIHFSFDYPKLEHAEIFTAMATLKLKGIKPFQYHDPLYVNHGYGNMLFPVELKPILISSSKEVYHWEDASFKAFTAYLKKIEQGAWKKTNTNGQTHKFESVDGNEVVTISLEGKTLTYEFFYPNQEE